MKQGCFRDGLGTLIVNMGLLKKFESHIFQLFGP